MPTPRLSTLAVSRDVILRAASCGEPQPVYGICREAESLVQVLGTKPEPDRFRRVGWVNPAGPIKTCRFTLEIDGQRVAFELDGKFSTPDHIVVLSGSESLELRRRGLVPKDGLGDKRVDLIGAGSLGSKIGVLLAEAGVGHLRVYDRDRLDTPNLSRHLCDLTDLGREKSVAVADKLSLHGVDALGVSMDVTAVPDGHLDVLLRSSDLIVATMDSPQAQFMINEVAVRNRVSAVFAGAYERACGGEIVTVRPGGGPCLFCAIGFRAGLVPGITLDERHQAYQGADQNRLDAEPGLGLDISYLASIAAAHALAVLDPKGSRADLLASDGFTLVHGPSRPRENFADLFRAPLEVVRARVIRDDPCPVCGFHSLRENVR